MKFDLVRAVFSSNEPNDACYASDVSVYGASFVRADTDRESSFRETCRLLREDNARVLAASPTSMAIEHTVRASEGCDWISIENAIGDRQLEEISRFLRTTALTVYAVDEKVLRFSYARFEEGRAARALEYLDNGGKLDRGRWTKAEGEPEPWEAILFSPKFMEWYAKRAPDEVKEACAENRIKAGFSIPWACDAGVVAEIARTLQLPWNPIEHDEFPASTNIEVIPGSPERWKAFLRRNEPKPWWKFW